MSGRPWELTDEERWAEAESILARHPTPAAEQRMTRKRLSLGLLIGGIVVVTTVGVLLLLLLTHSHERPQRVPRWQEITAAALQLIGFIVAFTGFVRRVRSDNWRERPTLPTTALRWRQRRELLQQLRGRRPVDPARLGLLRDLATRLAGPRGLLLIYLGLTLTWIGQGLHHPETWRIALYGCYVVLLMGVAAGVLLRQRQAHRFLERHGEAGAVQPAGTTSTEWEP